MQAGPIADARRKTTNIPCGMLRPTWGPLRAFEVSCPGVYGGQQAEVKLQYQ